MPYPARTTNFSLNGCHATPMRGAEVVVRGSVYKCLIRVNEHRSPPLDSRGRYRPGPSTRTRWVPAATAALRNVGVIVRFYATTRFHLVARRSAGKRGQLILLRRRSPYSPEWLALGQASVKRPVSVRWVSVIFPANSEIQGEFARYLDVVLNKGPKFVGSLVVLIAVGRSIPIEVHENAVRCRGCAGIRQSTGTGQEVGECREKQLPLFPGASNCIECGRLRRLRESYACHGSRKSCPSPRRY